MQNHKMLVDAWLWRRMDQLAAEQDIATSDLIRRILAQWLATEQYDGYAESWLRNQQARKRRTTPKVQ